MDYTAPKGMRDFLPEEMTRREFAVDTIKSVYRRFGFVPMETPALETVDVLEKKCGDEIKGQLFRVDDGRLALRFDLTVPLSRVASSNTFRKPFKRYCIAPVWRKEEPQKGRFREFVQADADIIGCTTMRAEAELIACACTAIEELGFSGATVRLNDRRIISAIAGKLMPGKEGAILRVLDKREKIGNENAVAMLVELGAKREVAKKLIDELTGGSSNAAKLKFAVIYSPEAAKDLQQIIDMVKEYDAKIKIELDFSLVRGLDYYTGPIFEIKLSDEIGSVGGGGRYDNLLSMYGQGDSAVGISLGIERLMALMKDRKSEKKGVFVAAVEDALYPYALQVASSLRSDGIPAQTDLNGRNLKKQIEYAASSCAWLVVVGEKEKKEKKITLRNLESGKEEMMSAEEAVKKIKK